MTALDRPWPVDCGASEQEWAPCPGCKQEARGEPCPCSGAPCCDRHCAESLISDAITDAGATEMRDGDELADHFARAAVALLLSKPELLRGLARAHPTNTEETTHD